MPIIIKSFAEIIMINLKIGKKAVGEQVGGVGRVLKYNHISCMHFGASFLSPFLFCMHTPSLFLSLSVSHPLFLLLSPVTVRRFKSPSGSSPPFRFQRPSNQSLLRRAATQMQIRNRSSHGA